MSDFKPERGKFFKAYWEDECYDWFIDKVYSNGTFMAYYTTWVGDQEFKHYLVWEHNLIVGFKRSFR